MSRVRDVIRSGVRTVGARWPSGGSGIPSMVSSMTRGKSSNAVPIPPARHEPALEAREMGRESPPKGRYVQDLHAGIVPSSKTGDYTDVQVVSPYGEIAWNRLGRISDEEMKRLSQDIMNRLYTFLFYLLTHGEPDRGMPLPTHWSPPHIEASIAAMWP